MGTWFMRIVVNTAHRHGRRMRWFGPRVKETLEGEGPSPETDSRAGQIRRRLTVSVGKLPKRQRTAFVLRYMEGLRTAETAEVMECAPGTVKASLHKAIGKLRRDLADLWAEERS